LELQKFAGAWTLAGRTEAGPPGVWITVKGHNKHDANLKADTLPILNDRMASFIHTNYVAHVYLQKVVENNTARTEPDYCEFYLNTFSSPNGYNINQGWPWQKIAGIGDPEAFWMKQHKLN
jgi:replicative superfamily II helicase